MRVVITGHTSGIGKAFFDFYNEKGYNVQGFSRSNGFDISNITIRCNLVAHIIHNCDIFINNAYSDDMQLKMMRLIDPHWKKDSSKIHVVIGSRAADIPISNEKYNKNKKDIDIAAIEMQKTASYKLMIVKPGRVDTPGLNRVRKSDIIKPMINVDSLVRLTDYLIRFDEMNVMSVTLEPKLKN
jgi:NADP-dependent 3-hydroxy acid dehydrogenase YdfG